MADVRRRSGTGRAGLRRFLAHRPAVLGLLIFALGWFFKRRWLSRCGLILASLTLLMWGALYLMRPAWLDALMQDAQLHPAKRQLRGLKGGKSGTGRCEKIDLETWSNFGPEKKRARIRFKRPPGLRHTFQLIRNFSQIDFFTSSRRTNPRSSTWRVGVSSSRNSPNTEFAS